MKIITNLFKIYFTFLFFLISLTSPCHAKVLFYDNFNTPKPSNWQIGEGNWVYSNGHYIGTTNNTPIYTHTNSGSEWTNYIFEVNIKNIYGVDKVIHFRANNPNIQRNNYAINLRDPYDADQGSDLTLNRNISPSDYYSLVSNQKVDIEPGDWQNIKIFAQDKKISVYLNDFKQIELEDKNNPSLNGRIGLEVWPGSFPGSQVAFDDVLVAEINTPVDPLKSTINASEKILPANGVDESIITITLVDFYGQPVSGKNILCQSNRIGLDVIEQPISSTDSKGQTTCKIKSVNKGNSVISVVNDEIQDITLFNNETITLSPVVTPTPTPTPFYPVILIPGHGASFNQETLIHNQSVQQQDWKMTPFVHTYDGIINTFKNNLSYPNNKLYVFYYDWRKKVEDITVDLNNFIENIVKPQNSDLTDFKTKIVGHSLGGLVARAYGQKYGVSKINKLVSVGSPQKGATEAYKAWEGGVTGDRVDWQWLGLQLLIQLNKRNFQTNTSVVRTIAPGTKDLLPVFNYLKSNTFSYKEKPVISMLQQNNWLNNLGVPNDDFFNVFSSIYGEKGNTPEFYKVTQPDLIDKILGQWEDGKPVSTDYGNGDKTILSKSANFDNHNGELLNLDHGELIEKESGIKKILDKLNISYSTVSESPLTIYSPSILFVLGSPAKLQVKKPDGSVINSDENKIIFIESAENGIYETKVIGETNGDYRLLIGQLTTKGDFWSEYDNQIINNKEDLYKIEFNKDQPKENPLLDLNGNNYLLQAKQNLVQLSQTCNNKQIKDAIADLDKTVFSLKRNKFNLALISIEYIIKDIFNARKKISNISCRNLSYEAIQNLELAYPIIFRNTKERINEKLLRIEINVTDKLLDITEQGLVKLSKKIKISTEKIISLSLAKENLQKAKESFNQKDYTTAKIILQIIKLLCIESYL